MRWLKHRSSHQRRYDELSESIREHLDEKIADLVDRSMKREKQSDLSALLQAMAQRQQ